MSSDNLSAAKLITNAILNALSDAAKIPIEEKEALLLFVRFSVRLASLEEGISAQDIFDQFDAGLSPIDLKFDQPPTSLE